MYSEFGFVEEPNLPYPDQDHLGDLSMKICLLLVAFLMRIQPFMANQ